MTNHKIAHFIVGMNSIENGAQSINHILARMERKDIIDILFLIATITNNLENENKKLIEMLPEEARLEYKLERMREKNGNPKI